MLQNKNYEHDVEYSIRFTRFVLQLLGAWPDTKRNTVLRRGLNFLLIFCSFFVLYFVLVPGILHMFIVEKIPRIRIYRIAPLLYCFMAVANFLRLVNSSLQQICLVEVLGCTMIICLLGYCILMEWENHNKVAMFSYTTSLLSISMNIFMFCYTGEQLNMQLERVSVLSCALEWYHLPKRKARSLILVIIISNLPTRMTAGKVIELSLRTFGDWFFFIAERTVRSLCDHELRISKMKTPSERTHENSKYETDIGYTIQVTRTVLVGRKYTILPSRYLYYIYGVENNARMKLKHSILVLYATMTVFKYSCLLLTQYKIKDCIDHVRQDWKVFGSGTHRQAMIKRARVGRRFFLFSWALMYVGTTCFRTILPLSAGKIVVDENTTIRPLSAPAYFIVFDVQKSPAYEIVFALQVCSGFVACTITITLCALMAVFVMHACGQLDVLEEVIKDLVHIDTLKKESLDGKLAIMVEHQIRVQQFVQMVEVTLQECSLIEVFACRQPCAS
ncbi:hypothetical protein KM043_005929 [Ampulex compressa]|nr:hypothetical protein KM043_005929 [Ampulex compressa]